MGHDHGATGEDCSRVPQILPDRDASDKPESLPGAGVFDRQVHGLSAKKKRRNMASIPSFEPEE
jgi:hypothetical protein